MYETMKPRDAAKIFDRLEVNVLLQVASMMNRAPFGSPGAHDARSGRAHRRARGSREDFAEGPQRQPPEDRRPSDRAVTPAHGALSEPPHAALPDRASCTRLASCLALSRKNAEGVLLK